MCNNQMDYKSIVLEESLKSDANHKHGAVIVKKGKILSSGYNQKAPTRSKYIKHRCHHNVGTSVHAEYSAIHNYLKQKPRKLCFEGSYDFHWQVIWRKLNTMCPLSNPVESI
jgi:tRNA(Arg) A34 adenosine deaminase TadA